MLLIMAQRLATAARAKLEHLLNSQTQTTSKPGPHSLSSTSFSDLNVSLLDLLYEELCRESGSAHALCSIFLS